MVMDYKIDDETYEYSIMNLFDVLIYDNKIQINICISTFTVNKYSKKKDVYKTRKRKHAEHRDLKFRLITGMVKFLGVL